VSFDGALIPLWLKLTYTVMVCVIVVVYAFKYPPGNFLWFSDIALIGTVPALWLEHRLLSSMLLLSILLPEGVWNAGYLGQLLTGKRMWGLAGYMFDASLPRYLRALSLFHVFLPALLLWMTITLGYDERALLAQTAVAWMVLLLSYRLTDPLMNVNWVFGPGNTAQRGMPPLGYLGLAMLVFPLLIYLPTHVLMRWWL
jgi:hypothetical protein